MQQSYSDNPRSIKYYVKRYLLEHQQEFKGKTVIDVPAGNGVTSLLLKELGAIPLPFDLFTEYFTMEGLACQKADVLEGLPLDGKSADFLICQEGIEHFQDQFAVFKEFNRLLKMNGQLLITTPNYSNVRARMSYLLSETERFNSMMPPNEIDTVWMNNIQDSNQIYFGHLFLIGIQKMRALAKLSGFRIKHIEKTRKTSASTFLLVFWYPWILLSSYMAYRKNIRKHKGVDPAFQKSVYREIYKLNINFRILVDSHLFVVFEKEKECDEVLKSLKSVYKEFGLT